MIEQSNLPTLLFALRIRAPLEIKVCICPQSEF